MSAEDRPSAMRRKAGAGRAPPEISQLTAGKALRASIAQAAQDVAALVAMAGAVDETRQTREPFADALPEHALLALIEGPDSRFGMVVVDPQAVAALIEIQTTGRVVPRAADSRPPTRTDAIMCADFIDRTLELLEARCIEADLDITPTLSGFRYAVALEDPRAVSMTLEDVPYRQLSCGIDLGRGAKQGALQVLVPFDPPQKDGHSHGDQGAFSDALEAQVMGTNAELAATLARRQMTLADVSGLQIGSLIPLPRSCLGNVVLEDIDGNVVTHGRLGQVQGHRAVRISVAADGDDADAPSGAAYPAAFGAAAPPSERAALGGGVGRDQGETSVGGLGDLGDLGGGGASDLSGMSGLSDLPGAGSTGTGGLGDMTDLPDLPDLAQLGTPLPETVT